MTVIFSNHLDVDCRMLRYIWEGIPDVNLIEILPTSENWEDMVDEALINEQDTLIMAGHGCGEGLMFPDFYKGLFIIHEQNVGLIHAKRVICCWCNASIFCEAHNLKSFSTSMFISNVVEATDFGFIDESQDSITDTEMFFCFQLNDLLIRDVPMEEWPIILNKPANKANPVDMFNRQGLTYIN